MTQPSQFQYYNPDSNQHPRNILRIGHYEVHKDKVIGRGSFGTVVESFFEDTVGRVKLACKIQRLDDKCRRSIRREIEALRLFNHKNIIRFYDYIEQGRDCYIFLEYCNGLDLNKLQQAKTTVSEEQTKIILKQILEGLRESQQRRIVHRDLKLANIFLHFPDQKQLDSMTDKEKFEFLKTVDLTCEEFEIKIADFGFARELRSSHEWILSNPGTPFQMSPQQLQNIPYTRKSDIWSLGCMLYELLTGKLVFFATTKQELIHKMKRGTYSLPKSIEISLDCLDFLNCCLQYNEDRRSSLEELFAHKFMQPEPEFDFEVHDSYKQSIRLILSQSFARQEQPVVEERKQGLERNSWDFESLERQRRGSVIYLNAKDEQFISKLYDHVTKICRSSDKENVDEEEKVCTLSSFQLHNERQKDTMMTRKPIIVEIVIIVDSEKEDFLMEQLQKRAESVACKTTIKLKRKKDHLLSQIPLETFCPLPRDFNFECLINEDDAEVLSQESNENEIAIIEEDKDDEEEEEGEERKRCYGIAYDQPNQEISPKVIVVENDAIQFTFNEDIIGTAASHDFNPNSRDYNTLKQQLMKQVIIGSCQKRDNSNDEGFARFDTIEHSNYSHLESHDRIFYQTVEPEPTNDERQYSFFTDIVKHKFDLKQSYF